MKKEYTLSQQFAVIALDGLSCLHRSAAKGAAVRGIAAATFLEEILPIEESKALPAKKAGAAETFQRKFQAGIAAVKRMKRKEMDALEKEMAAFLVTDGGMEIVPDLLGCDMNYYTAKVTIKSYRSNRDVYLSVVESMRAEILEEGPVTLECVCLLWLMRESGCLHDIFSVKEQVEIQDRMMRLCAAGNRSEENPEPEYAGMIWGQEFHKTREQMVKSFLRGKREVFKNPYLEGINLLFPFLDRRQAIFVDFVVFGKSVKERRQAVIDFLSENGHHVEEVKNGAETLLRIDNGYYRIWPKTVSSGRIPIQGASLQPVYR